MKQLQKRPTRADFFASDKKNIGMLYAAFLLFNILLAIQYRAPFAYPDEYGVFSIGNWMLGGVDWGYKTNMYYGYTFSPFAGIMLRLFHGIRPVYIGSLCIKACQVSLIPVLSYKFLHEVLEVENTRVKLLLSTMVSLYPSLTLYAKYVSNETTLHVTLFACFYLIGKLAAGQTKNTTRLYSTLLGFLAAFAYATHGMGLAFIVAVCLVVPVAHIGTKKKLVSYPFFCGSLAVFYLLDSKIKDIIMNTVFYIPEEGMINTFSHTFNTMVGNLLTPGFFPIFFRIVASQLLYISAATFGMAVLAFIILLLFIFRFAKARFAGGPNPRDNALFVSAVFGMAIFFCAVGLSALSSVSVSQPIGRMYYYGRYYEYTALPLILTGLYCVFERDVKKKELLKYLIATFVCYLLLSIYNQIQVLPFVSETLNRFFILGILPFVGNTVVDYVDVGDQSIPIFDLFALWLVTVSMFLLTVWLLKGRHRFWAPVVIAALFLYGTFFDHFIAVAPLSVANYNHFYSNMEPLESALGEFRDVYDQYPYLYIATDRLGTASSVSSLTRGRAQLSFVNYRVALPLRIEEINMVADDEAVFENSFIVSDQDLECLNENDSYLKIYESSNARIWIRGKEIIAYYNNR